MSFLNTIMLAGLAAVAVPIIIHLLNRRKFKTVTWAAMKFVKLSVDQNQRRMRIEDLILLLIRCALVALLALALARPALKDSSTDVLGQAKVTGIVILDNSYSMDLRLKAGESGDSGGGATFEQARKAAKATVDALPSGSAVGVLLASDIVRGVIDEPTYDLNQAHAELDRAQVSHHATDLFPAVESAVNILKERADLRKEIYIVTDGQASGWQQNADIQKLIEDNKGDIDVYVLRVGEDTVPGNMAITKLDVSSGLTPVKHPLRIEVEVANHGKNEWQDVTVNLYVDERPDPVDQVNIPTVKAGETVPVPLFARLEKEGYHSIRASFNDPERYDSLPADNQNRLVVNAVSDVRVLVVDGDGTASDPRDNESFFLGVALSPVDGHYVQVDVSSPEAMSQAILSKYTTIVFANVERFTEDNIKAMRDYLLNGGGLIFYPGDQVEVDHYNEELFKKHGILPSPWGLPVGDAGQDEEYQEFQKRGYEHPVTAPWENPEFGSIGSARTFRWLPLSDESEQPEVEEAGLPRVVLRYQSRPDEGEEEGELGGPAIMERDWGTGRVFQFSSTADIDWSDLAIRGPSVVPLLYRIIGNIQANRDSGLNLRVGEPFRKVLAANEQNKEGLVFDKGAVQSKTLTPETIGAATVLQYPDTHRAGVYRFSIKGSTETNLFAVQPDQRESDLFKIEDGDLPADAQLIKWEDDANFKAKVQEARVGAEYWLVILLIVLALAGLETFLAQKFSQSK